MSAVSENNFHNRVDILEIPEGWRSVAYELVLQIDEYLQSHEDGHEIFEEWKISSIDINKNGKMTITGTHLRNLIDPIVAVGKIAESVCCICGNHGQIETTKLGIKLPLCKAHLISANSL